MECQGCVKQRRAPRVKGRLSRREADIFAMIAQGCSNTKTAERLFITEKTVKFHLTNIYKKLGVTHRGELIHGWFTRAFPEHIVEPVHAILPTHAAVMAEEAKRKVLPAGV